jgi:hypothetical protein
MLRQLLKRLFGSSNKGLRITLEFEDEVQEKFLSLVHSVGSNPRDVLIDSIKLYDDMVEEYLAGTKFYKQEVGYGIVPVKYFGEETGNSKKKIVCITDKDKKNSDAE